MIFLRTAGLTAVPQFLNRIEIARSLGCKPWEMDDVPLIWQHWAAIALDVRRTLTAGTTKG